MAQKHLQDKTLIRYDVTSSHREGKSGPLAALGSSRDGKKGKQPIIFGLLRTPKVCQIAGELFSGNPADPNTVISQIEKLRKRFGINRIALVGDRGMMTTARIREHWDPAGIAWISALKSTDLRKLAQPPRNPNANPTQPPLAPEALVPDAVAEFTSPDFPGESMMVGLNPSLRKERHRKWEELLKLTEPRLERITASVRAGTYRCYSPLYLEKSCVFILHYFGHKRSDPAVGCPIVVFFGRQRLSNSPHDLAVGTSSGSLTLSTPAKMANIPPLGYDSVIPTPND